MKSFFKNVLSTSIGMMLGTILSLILIPIFIAVLVKGFQSQGARPVVENSILHLRMNGQLVERHRPLDFTLLGDRSIFTEDRTIGLFEVNEAIERAKTDKRIVGMYIEIRNFDANWAALTALRRKIEEFAATGKWVYAYADRYDEGGYYLATAANQIFVQPHGDIEINGLAATGVFFKGLLDKLELDPVIFRVGKFKSAVEPFTQQKMSEENREQTQALVNDFWGAIRSSIATATKQEENRIDEIAQGLLVSSAAKAMELGLVHETIFEDVVEERMKNFTVGKDEDLRLVTPNQLLAVSTPRKSASGKKIAVIFAEGEIMMGQGGRSQIGSEALRQEIIDAKEDESTAAIVLRVNSPGGDALASDVIWRELLVTDETIPVVVSLGDIAASGGYYIASAGRYIFAEPTTITGSIGVFGLLFNAQTFLDRKVGVNFDRVVTHPYADIGAATRPMHEVEAQTIQGEVERVYKRFLDVVQEGRGYEKRTDLESIAEGRVWSGLRAKEIGLVDELGGLEQAIAKASELASLGQDYELEIYPRQMDPFLQFLEQVSGGTIRTWLEESGLKSFSEVASVVPRLRNGIYTRLPYELKVR